MIIAQHLSKNYGSLEVLHNVSLSINKGEIVAIAGPSGAGKTTLLQIISSLDKADSGSVIFNGTDLSKLSSRELASFRNKNMGFVFQFHQLLPEFTALENICLPAWIGKADRKQTLNKAEELLELMGISARKHHKPSELSGGESQRVAVARALINNPAVVFADEPSGNLDTTNATDLHKLFFNLRNQLGQTFVIVTHNETLAHNADRILKMKDGHLLQ